MVTTMILLRLGKGKSFITHAKSWSSYNFATRLVLLNTTPNLVEGNLVNIVLFSELFPAKFRQHQEGGHYVQAAQASEKALWASYFDKSFFLFTEHVLLHTLVRGEFSGVWYTCTYDHLWVPPFPSAKRTRTRAFQILRTRHKHCNGDLCVEDLWLSGPIKQVSWDLFVGILMLLAAHLLVLSIRSILIFLLLLLFCRHNSFLDQTWFHQKPAPAVTTVQIEVLTCPTLWVVALAAAPPMALRV